MSSSQEQEQLRAKVQARVEKHGSIDAARPSNITERAWRETCAHLGVITKPKKANTLELALEAVRELVDD